VTRPEPRRIRDKDHLRFVAKQPCLICGRTPADPHHQRSAKHRSFGRKVSDELTVRYARAITEWFIVAVMKARGGRKPASIRL
jgi:hypothetical protein